MRWPKLSQPLIVAAEPAARYQPSDTVAIA